MAKHYAQAGGSTGDQAPSASPYDQDAWEGSSADATNVSAARPVPTVGYTPLSSEEGRMRNPYMYDDGRDGRRHGILLPVIIVILAVILAVGGFTAYNVYKGAKVVTTEANSVMDSLDKIKSAAKSGDTATIQTAASDINGSAHRIQNEVQSPWWGLAALVPVYGSDVRSIQVLGDVLVDLSDNALSPMAYGSDALDLSKLASNGRINVEAVQSLATAVKGAQPVFERNAQAIAALPDAHISKLGTVLSKVKDQMATANDGLAKANAILPYLPAMLGADGQTRQYLVVSQNNAEMRPTGGLPGSWGLITASDGQLVMGEFESPWKTKSSGGVTMTKEEAAVFDPAVRSDMQVTWKAVNSNFNPNMPRSAEFMRGYWRTKTGSDVDGVIFVDPIFLQYLLGVTGGVTTSTGAKVDGSNAASQLLNRVYYDVPSDQQDAYFSSVAGQVFGSLFADLGSVDTIKLLDAFNKGASQGHLQVWMQNADEEQVMRALDVSGEVSTDPNEAQVGIYFYNQDNQKSDWYLRLDTAVGPATANADGTTSYQLTTTLVNTLDGATLASAPAYINFRGGYMLNDILLYAPAGGSISNVACSTTSGGSTTFGEHSLDGFDVWSGLVKTPAQATTTITYTVTTAAGVTAAPTIRTTPLCQDVQ